MDIHIPATYQPQQILHVLKSLDIDVMSDTMTDYQCLCPFHGNRHTPSFSISKTTGAFLCFNDSCGERGTLLHLIKSLAKANDYQAWRMIAAGRSDSENFDEGFKRLFKEEPEPTFGEDVIQRMKSDFWASQEAIDYMTGRGFDTATLKHYDIGYSNQQHLIAVPMRNTSGSCVGVIGRSLEGKRFKNSPGLPVRSVLWNLDKAKGLSDSVIVCEASFDAMKISQAGYPNVVACLGGNFNEKHASLLGTYFNRIVIMTDWDDSNDPSHKRQNCRKCKQRGFEVCKGHNPGRDTGRKISGLMKGKEVMWAVASPFMHVYPEGCKDAGDLNGSQINKMIGEAMTKLEYSSWDPYYASDVVY